MLCEIAEGRGSTVFRRIEQSDGRAFVSAGAGTDVDGNLPQKRHSEFFRFASATSFSKDVIDLSVGRTFEVTHVFDDAEDGCLDFFEESYSFAGIDKGNFLRGCDDDGSVEICCLHDGQLDVSRSGGQIKDQEVDVTPFYVAKELLDVSGGQWSANSDGRGFVDHQADGKQADTVRFDRNEFVVLVGSGTFLSAEHESHGRTIDIQIDQADFITEFREGDCEVGGDCGFTDTAFAGSDGDDVLGSGDGGLPRSGIIIDRLVGCGRFVVDVDIAVLDSGDVLHDVVHPFEDVTGDIGVAAFDLEIDDDIVVIVDGNVFYNAERNDVPAESGIFDRRQSGPDEFRREWLL